MKNARRDSFNAILFDWHKKHYRYMEWRDTTDPYRILVSELMLQQTQVVRVTEKYPEFIKRFPTAKKLAASSLGDVLRLWSGLGYNRRAKYLHQCAKQVTLQYHGKFPCTYNELITLPGIGRSTAGALLAFAFGQDTPMIDTNIRRVLVRVFKVELKRLHLRRSGAPPTRQRTNSMPRSSASPRLASKGALAPLGEFIPSDKELYDFALSLIPKRKGRMWNYAMLDLGAMLCTARNHSPECPLMKLHGKVGDFIYKKSQKKFSGSERYYRGKILKLLTLVGKATLARLKKELVGYQRDPSLLLAKLVNEGLISQERAGYRLPN